MEDQHIELEMVERLLEQIHNKSELTLVPGEVLPGLGPYVGVMEVRPVPLILYNDDIRSTRTITVSELTQMLESLFERLSGRVYQSKHASW